MRPSRARLVAFVTLLLPAIELMSTAAAAGDFTATRLYDDLLMVTGPAGNTLVGVDTDGLVLVDGVPAQYAGQYLDFVRRVEVPGGPCRPAPAEPQGIRQLHP